MTTTRTREALAAAIIEKQQAVVKRTTEHQTFLSAEENWTNSHLLLDEALIDEGISSIARHTATIINLNHAPLLLTVHPHGIGFGYKLARAYYRFEFDVEEAHIDLDGDKIVAHPTANRLQGRTVIIAITLLSHGRDLHAVKEWCIQQGARAIYCFSLIDVKAARDIQHTLLTTNYTPFSHDTTELMGFGLGASCFANRPIIRTMGDRHQHSFERNIAIGAIMPALYLNLKIAENETAVEEFAKSKATITKLCAETDENLASRSVYYSEEDVDARIDSHALALSDEFTRENYLQDLPVLLLVLDGALTYGASLFLRMTGYFQVATIKISRYGSSQEGSAVTFKGEPSIPVAGRRVVAVDELIEHGETLKTVAAICKAKGATSVRFVTLFHKEIIRSEACKDIRSSLPSLPVPDRWGIGMGLDETPLGRNLPFLLLHPPKPKTAGEQYAVEALSLKLK